MRLRIDESIVGDGDRIRWQEEMRFKFQRLMRKRQPNARIEIDGDPGHCTSNRPVDVGGATRLLCGLIITIAMFTSDALTGLFAQERDASVTMSMSPSGIRRHVMGRWAAVTITADNTTNADSQQTAAVFVRNDRNQQFARMFWVPAQSKRRVSLPLLIPTGLIGIESQIDVSMMQLDESAAGEQFRSNSLGMAISKRSLMLSWEDFRTAFVIDQTAPDGSGVDPETLKPLTDLIYAARNADRYLQQDLGAVRVDTPFLPASPVALDALDQVILASDRIRHDSLGMLNLQRWVHDGGRLWIMLNQTGPELVTELLADAAPITVIDRVELNEFQLDWTDTNSRVSGSDQDASKGKSIWTTRETPVELIRLMTSCDDISASIDGWPAACWFRVGAGEVLVTSLDAPGWMEGDRLNAIMKPISDRFFVNRDEPTVDTASMVPMLDQEIGYEIPSRVLAAGILAGNIVAVLIGGLFWARRKRLERIGIVIPVCSVLAASVFLWVARGRTHSINPTIAASQVIRIMPDVSAARTDAVATVYSPSAKSLDLVSDPTTLAMLDKKEASQRFHRLTWDDRGYATWDSELPPGTLRHFQARSMQSMTRPGVVEGILDVDGFQGRLRGVTFNSVSDAFLFAPGAPVTAAQVAMDQADGDGGVPVTGKADDLLARGQFTRDAVLSDTQQARQAVLRRLLSDEQSALAGPPALMFWTEAELSGFTVAEDFQRRSQALVSIPIRLNRLPPGASFKVPATLMRLQPASSSQGVSAVYNPRTGQFNEMTKPASVQLSCLLPDEVVPCDLQHVSIDVKVTAPARTVQIQIERDGELETLATVSNPARVIHCEVTRPQWRVFEASDGIALTIDVSPTQSEREIAQSGQADVIRTSVSNRWQIEYVHISTEGVTQ